jgi:hypothetical protein
MGGWEEEGANEWMGRRGGKDGLAPAFGAISVAIAVEVFTAGENHADI